MIQRSFGTHDGSFHADEVTACSLLLLFDLIDRDKIIRSRDLRKLEKCDYVCDVGGIYDPRKRRFDHHQIEYQGPMSSAGMVLLYLKNEKIMPPHLYDWFNNMIILGVDAHDNGRAHLENGVTTFSHVVSNFLPVEYEVPNTVMEEAFLQALDFVVGHLDRLKNRFLYTQLCSKTVQKQMKESQSLLVFDHPIPWMESFFDLGGVNHPAKFVMMPSGQHWKLRGIPPNLNERMRVRKPFPESWAGLQNEELRKVTGIDGAIFCHKGRFISIWKTKEDAMQAYHLTMKEV